MFVIALPLNDDVFFVGSLQEPIHVGSPKQAVKFGRRSEAKRVLKDIKMLYQADGFVIVHWPEG